MRFKKMRPAIVVGFENRFFQILSKLKCSTQFEPCRQLRDAFHVISSIWSIYMYLYVFFISYYIPISGEFQRFFSQRQLPFCTHRLYFEDLTIFRNRTLAWPSAARRVTREEQISKPCRTTTVSAHARATSSRRPTRWRVAESSICASIISEFLP